MRKKSETFEKKLVKTKLVKTKLVKVLGQITQRWTKISEFQFFVRLLLRTQDTQRIIELSHGTTLVVTSVRWHKLHAF